MGGVKGPVDEAEEARDEGSIVYPCGGARKELVSAKRTCFTVMLGNQLGIGSGSRPL